MTALGTLEKSMVPLYLTDLFFFINLDKLRILIGGQYMKILQIQVTPKIEITLLTATSEIAKMQPKRRFPSPEKQAIHALSHNTLF